MRRTLERFGKLAFARIVALFLGGKRISAEEFSRMPISRLLVIRQHNQMGDMLLAVPAFRGLRRRFSNARITLVAASINRGVALRNPYVDEVLTYAKERTRRSPLALVRFIGELRRRRFDAVIVLNTVSFSITSMLLSVASGARVRVGSTSVPFGHDLSSKFYHLELPLPDPSEAARMHESAHNLYPLSPLGVHERDLRSALVATPEERAECERFIAAAVGAGRPFIIVHPGAGKRRNQWPPERFARVVSALNDRLGTCTVAVRGPVDADAMDAFLSSCPVCPAVVSLPEVGFLGALMERAVITLCNDTGIMHIAGAVGAPCVAVFGPTDPARWKPVNDEVAAVRAEDGLIESVTVDSVLSRALALLGE
jgi:ADP-heptose:LPS heptosyltransferase